MWTQHLGKKLAKSHTNDHNHYYQSHALAPKFDKFSTNVIKCAQNVQKKRESVEKSIKELTMEWMKTSYKFR